MALATSRCLKVMYFARVLPSFLGCRTISYAVKHPTVSGSLEPYDLEIILV